MGTLDAYEVDVLILGGGLAGLTLGMQLQRRRANIRLLVADKAPWPPPAAAHKVGESTVELASHYLREVLGLREYLEAEQLPKLGLRFFFDAGVRDDLAQRPEMGATGRLPVPSHQLDRGTLEKELGERYVAAGGTHLVSHRVGAIDLHRDGHTVVLKGPSGDVTVRARWVVDATGRAGTLKRKLGLVEANDHTANAVWFRVDEEIDLDDFCADPAWRARVAPGIRRLSTNHLMGEGYWVWFIPLASGSTSVGIVTDGPQHDLKAMSTPAGALRWLEEHEPLAARAVAHHMDRLQDFLLLRHYSHHSGAMFSPLRWALTGDAGAFLDPFYSPGSDFISLANSYITDLVLRDLDGERIRSRVGEYNRTYLEMVRAWLPVYRGMYATFGVTQVAAFKVAWDFSTYWSFQVSTFVNDRFVDLPFMIRTRELWQRITELNRNLQANLLRWAQIEPQPNAVRADFVDPMTVPFMRDFHVAMPERLDADALTERLTQHLARLERIAAEMLRRAARRLYGTPVDLAIDPYTFSLEGDPDRPEGAFALPAPLGPDAATRVEVQRVWFAHDGVGLLGGG